MAEKNREQPEKIRVHYDDAEGWTIPKADLEKLMEQAKPAEIKAPVPVKKDIPTKKFLLALVIVAAALGFGIWVPDSRVFLAFLAFFGFGSFLQWLNTN